MLNVTVYTGKEPKVTFQNLDGKPENAENTWIWTPAREWIEAPDGSVLESRNDPRASFADHNKDTKWDNMHLLYFSGYAFWNYCTAPFYFTWPGFSFKELPAESDPTNFQRWRVLEVTFPENFPTHCKVQKFYFDSTFLLRRLDYVAEVAGPRLAAHEVYDHRDIEALWFPMLRRVVLHPQGIEDGGPSTILFDFHRLAVKYADGTVVERMS